MQCGVFSNALCMLSIPNQSLVILDNEYHRIGVESVVGVQDSFHRYVDTDMLAVAGSLIAGPALGWLVVRMLDRAQHMPTAIILQFATTSASGFWPRALASRVC